MESVDVDAYFSKLWRERYGTIEHTQSYGRVNIIVSFRINYGNFKKIDEAICSKKVLFGGGGDGKEQFKEQK